MKSSLSVDNSPSSVFSANVVCESRAVPVSALVTAPAAWPAGKYLN